METPSLDHPHATFECTKNIPMNASALRAWSELIFEFDLLIMLIIEVLNWGFNGTLGLKGEQCTLQLFVTS